MLELLRRYQKFLYIVITVVIVISFTFFGASTGFSGPSTKDTVAFVAVDGSKVYRSELTDVMQLLAGDSRDLIMTGSGNAFNDGVIATDILGTKVVDAIAAQFLPQFHEELTARLEKEKHFTPYTHPNAPVLSAEQVWNYFAPDIKKYYDQLREQEDEKVSTVEAFQTRVKLYVAERHFPQSYLKQFLRYQEKQQNWIQPDENLAHRDLSLFGYHTLQDWFGKRFLEVSAQFVINAAKIAESQGMTVSKEEVLSSIVHNATSCFKEYERQLQGAGRESFDSYFHSELRKLGMDQPRLLEAWKTCLLFRRLMKETAESVLVSDAPYRDFYKKLNEYVEIDAFKLPRELTFKTARDLARFEIYVKAVQDSKARGGNVLMLSNKCRTAQEVRTLYPELVEKRYRIRYTAANKSHLESKIGVKKVWEWEVEDKNWKAIQSKFSEISSPASSSKEARQAVLDNLDSKTRGAVDAFARAKIVDENPAWLEAALQATAPLEGSLVLREQGGKMPFEGIANRRGLLEVMDTVPLAHENPLLKAYSQDGVHYYKIVVLERDEKPQVMSLRAALQDGTMDLLLDKALEAAYPRLRAKTPQQYVKESGEWKPFQDVKELLIAPFLAEGGDVYDKLSREVERMKKENPNFCNWNKNEEALMACRLLPYMNSLRTQIVEKPENSSTLIFDPAKELLSEQFKLVQVKERVIRGAPSPTVNVDVAFSTEPAVLSLVNYTEKGGLSFFKVVGKGELSPSSALHERVYEAKGLLEQELSYQFANVLVTKMKAKNSFATE